MHPFGSLTDFLHVKMATHDSQIKFSNDPQFMSITIVSKFLLLVDVVESQLKSVELQMKAKDDELKDKDKIINKLQSEVESLRVQTDDLEQYGRRQSLRLYNVSLEGCADSEEAALKVFNDTMKVKVSADEIERAHPLGQKQIIVEFKSYKTKAVVYKAKSSLKDNGDGIFMTEDLMKRNHAIIKQLLLLKKSDKIHSFWTVDGKKFHKNV